MQTINLQTLKSKGSSAIPDDHVIYLIVNSKPKSVLVPPEEYTMLIAALEELEDMKAIEERKNEGTVSFDAAFARQAS